VEPAVSGVRALARARRHLPDLQPKGDVMWGQEPTGTGPGRKARAAAYRIQRRRSLPGSAAWRTVAKVAPSGHSTRDLQEAIRGAVALASQTDWRWWWRVRYRNVTVWRHCPEPPEGYLYDSSAQPD